MRPRDRRSTALAIGAILTLALAGSTLAAGGPGPDGMTVLRVRDAHGSHGGGPFGGGGNSNPNLYSHGGSVEVTPSVYISFWGAEWDTGFTTGTYTSAQARTYVEDFFGGVGGSAWNGSVTQYCQDVASGAYSCAGGTLITNPTNQLKGTWVDTTTVPNRPKQSDIAAAAARLASHFGGVKAGATYFVFTPSGKSMSGFGTRWCAWHSSNSSLAYAYMPFIPDAGGSCGMNFVNSTDNSYGNGYFDGFSVVGGHEYAEAETDPFPSTGWLDSGGAENGDKCAWSSASTNITLGSNDYAVQPLWSNADKGCVVLYTH